MSEKNKISNIIAEIIKVVVVLGMLIIAYFSGVLTNEDGGFDLFMLMFLFLPLTVIGKSLYNLYRNYKYRKK